jgi:hypothetical protein
MNMRNWSLVIGYYALISFLQSRAIHVTLLLAQSLMSISCVCYKPPSQHDIFLIHVTLRILNMSMKDATSNVIPYETATR